MLKFTFDPAFVERSIVFTLNFFDIFVGKFIHLDFMNILICLNST